MQRSPRFPGHGRAPCRPAHRRHDAGVATGSPTPASPPAGSPAGAVAVGAVHRSGVAGGDVTRVPGVGADGPFTEDQAEDARTDHTVLGPAWVHRTLAVESTGRRSVQRRGTGKVVEFTLTKAANADDLSCSIPDSVVGRGLDATLGVSVDGNYARWRSRTSRYSWYDGRRPWSDDPTGAARCQLLGDVRVAFGKPLPGDQDPPTAAPGGHCTGVHGRGCRVRTGRRTVPTAGGVAVGEELRRRSDRAHRLQ